MVSAKCYICNSSKYSIFTSVKDDITDELFTIVQCVCDFCYVYPRPPQDEIEKYYKLSSYHPHSKGNGLLYSIYKLIQKITFRNKFKLLKKYSTLDFSHLDYGGGDGSFSRYLNKNKNIFSSYFDPFYEDSPTIDFDNASFNMITLWHVLEHSYDLDLLFKDIDNSLTETGLLFIAVPNIEALERPIYLDKWAAYDVPRHLYHFSNKTLSELLDKKGYRVIKKKRMLFDTFYISILSSMKISKMAVMKSIISSCFIACKILLKGPKYSSSLLYVCKRKK